MKSIVIALLLVLMAATAGAQTLYDINTGLVPQNTLVQVVNVTVTATRYNGFFCQEAPNAEYNGIWVYSGVDLGFAPGDVVSLQGEYYNYYDVPEIDVTAGLVQPVGSGPVPAPAVVPAAVLIGSGPLGPWVSSLVTIPDQGVVSSLPSSYGEWNVDYTEGTLLFDDYWYDDTTVMLGDCYDSVTGVIYYAFSSVRMEPLADGIDFCPIAVEEQTFGTLKAQYR